MTLVEQILFECSKQRGALSSYYNAQSWSIMPFCRNAEYYYYYALVKQTQPQIITQIDPDENNVRCFLKTPNISAVYGEPTHIFLEGPYAGLLAKSFFDSSVDHGRYLFDTCTRVYEHNEIADFLISLPPHTFIDVFLSLLQEKSISCDAKQLRKNSLTYSAWIQRKTKKKM